MYAIYSTIYAIYSSIYAIYSTIYAIYSTIYLFMHLTICESHYSSIHLFIYSHITINEIDVLIRIENTVTL